MALKKAKELRAQRAQVWGQANEILQRAEAEKRERTAEENEQIDRAHDDMERLAKEAERLERHAELDIELSRSRGTVAGLQDGEEKTGSIDEQVDTELRNWLLKKGPQAANKEFELRGGLQSSAEARAMAREHRAQGTTPGSAGGHTVPEGFHRVLETALLHFGGMRQARTTILRTGEGNDLPMPTSDDTSNEGVIIDENPSQKVSEQDLTFGQKVLRAHMYSSKSIRVSFQLLQDSAFDLPSYIAERLGERIARVTNRHFTVGTGSGQPEGVVTGATLGKAAVSPTAITDTELIDLQHAIDIAYRRQAEWMFHDTTLRELKKLKDSEGRPLWLPGLAVREPDTILSHRYVVNNHMPEIGAGNKAVLFGDFSKYYIRDVMDLRLIRLDEVYAEWAQVAFLAFSRHDGGLLDAGTHPIKYLQLASSGD